MSPEAKASASGDDDGIEAEGLACLERIARTLSDDVWIVAPQTEQSAKGRGITLTEPLRVNRLGDKRFAVTGTPTARAAS